MTSKRAAPKKPAAKKRKPKTHDEAATIVAEPIAANAPKPGIFARLRARLSAWISGIDDPLTPPKED